MKFDFKLWIVALSVGEKKVHILIRYWLLVRGVLNYVVNIVLMKKIMVVHSVSGKGLNRLYKISSIVD